MFELSLYLLPSHSLSLSLPLKFIQGLLYLRAFLTWPFCVGVYHSSSMAALTLAFRKNSLSLSKKRQKGFACGPFNHKL